MLHTFYEVMSRRERGNGALTLGGSFDVSVSVGIQAPPITSFKCIVIHFPNPIRPT